MYNEQVKVRVTLGLPSRKDQSMPISKASSRSLAFIGIIPFEPTPTGI